jgi:hypothetical protein
MAHKHARIIQHSFTESLQGALLDSYEEEQRCEQLYITLNIRASEHTASELFERNGKIYERVQGNYIAMQLRFSRVSGLQSNDFFTNLPLHEDTRRISDVLSWRQAERQDVFYLFMMQAPQIENLMFFANRVAYERLPYEASPFTLERDWCHPPPMPDRLIPQPNSLHQHFGGDPITLHMGSRLYHQRLFIGGLEVQGYERPQVDVVFNVGEKPSNWVKNEKPNSEDRWDNKGEGSDGMSSEVIREEANWVAQRLRENKRVLIHCVAGMNRSSTICCAVLILLEDLTAEQALERVREHHPWARPDSRHWLKLRWLAKTNS